MARSNGPAGRPTQRPQQPHPHQGSQQGWPADGYQGQPPPPPHAYDPYAQQDPYHYPQGAGGYADGMPSRPTLSVPTHAADPQGHYAHQPDPYAVDPRQQAYAPAPHEVYRPPVHEPSYDPVTYPAATYPTDPYARVEPGFPPPPDAAAFDHARDLRGPVHDQWSQPAPQPAMGYDAGRYEPALPQGFAQHQPEPSMPAPGWPPQDDPYARYPAEPAPAEPEGYAAYQMAEPQGGPLTEQELDEDYEEYEEPRGRGRMVMIAAALIGAIGIGGALAFAYKTMIGPGGTDNPPLVKNEAAPSKMRPAEPGGKQFAHTDSKIMGRLNETGSVAAATTAASTAATAGESEAGTRKVQTLVVGRDGSIEAPAQGAAPAQSAPVVSVPGMTVIDGFNANPAAQLREAQRPVVVNPPQAPPTPPVAEKAPEKPVVIARAAPVAQPDATAELAETVTPPVTKPVPKRQAAVAPAAAPAPRASGAGYVAVLASVPASSSSRMEALKQFADLRQKYGTVLQSKTPEVTEANLGAKGTYHRLVVGPPGSREQASGLCSQLKGAGYAGCWVTAY